MTPDELEAKMTETVHCALDRIKLDVEAAVKSQGIGISVEHFQKPEQLTYSVIGFFAHFYKSDRLWVY